MSSVMSLPLQPRLTEDPELNPSNAKALLGPKHKTAKILENHLNSVMLAFIRELSPSILRLAPMCQGFSHFSTFLHRFVLAKLATSNIRVNTNMIVIVEVFG